MSKQEDQPKAAPFIRVGVAGKNRPDEVGSKRRQSYRLLKRGRKTSSHKKEWKKN